MRQAWGDFLADGVPCSHGAQLYSDPNDLVESVATFAGAGFERGEPSVLAIAREHVPLVLDALARSGFDAAQEEGLLLIADADVMLETIMVAGRPSPERFETAVVELLDAVERPGRPVRVFGEMVDLLVRRGEASAADELERLWNELAARRPFSLLCGYRVDVFDGALQAETLPNVCARHSHVLPARNYPRFAAAVDEALHEVLGPAGASEAYARASQAADVENHVPLAQLILMWVARHRPAESARVLLTARLRYAGA